MRIRLSILLFLAALFIGSEAGAASAGDTVAIRIMSYNTENYLSYRHDSLSPCFEFSPRGMRAWTYERYRLKRDNIAKVIAAVGQWNPPALVALCEIENEEVLSDLTLRSPLKNLKYKSVHFESPDPRGIDVALLYQPKLFRLIKAEPIPVLLASDTKRHTRDILYAEGILTNGDTLHVFVNHFPSRMGGELESESGRAMAAETLRHKTDSLVTLNRLARIVIMGDFNDYPDNKSMREVLGALPDSTPPEQTSLINLFYTTHKAGKTGSYKHAGQWGMLDQIIVSAALLSPDHSTAIQPGSARVFDDDFLLEEDTGNFGKQPFRTYAGMQYHGGFSDHLPVYVDMIIRKFPSTK
jgi:predicted extracellular nuclease